MSTIHSLPEQLLLKVFSYVSLQELAVGCRPVSRQWKELVDDRFQSGGMSEGLADWGEGALAEPVRQNLIKNPCGEDGLDFWELMENGGSGWKVEELPGDNGKAFPNENIQKYFVTSFEWCQKSQLINLVSEGWQEEMVDNTQPPIVVRDWYAGRHDSGCEYELHVELLSEDLSVLEEFKSDTVQVPQWGDAEWAEISHTFTDYGPGVRYVRFSHRGKDAQYWDGWFGARVTHSSITVGH
uniref:F-box protein 2 n=1 Tax=Callorhinchus milii TaxID=7868 RepID=V9L393_CALMI|eukprot:gi/632960034/ref/XP_007895965.1/ PREDICTED: F-box only protein 2 [Callorhinchus milii]